MPRARGSHQGGRPWGTSLVSRRSGPAAAIAPGHREPASGRAASSDASSGAGPLHPAAGPNLASGDELARDMARDDEPEPRGDAVGGCALGARPSAAWRARATTLSARLCSAMPRSPVGRGPAGPVRKSSRGGFLSNFASRGGPLDSLACIAESSACGVGAARSRSGGAVAAERAFTTKQAHHTTSLTTGSAVLSAKPEGASGGGQREAARVESHLE